MLNWEETVTHRRKEAGVEFVEVRRTTAAERISKNLAEGDGRSKLQSFRSLNNGGS